ncbi:metallopeptidase TldD-related protein [Oceanirhabdus sp. W0125-5]|uniref:metallopeptidase TldD-related protein n=1 Tax=Oceanirhabdus sp. W0125-5 TaxID=2999116 RepID=UPI0022F31D71|nr:metallopeptidase TldD-related protein [Oceanirhabdus sp. W0125-5]WBW99047.1 metallopeptidase TldD-related protein [Oceanirhabdus sp. W0125-5]
MIREKYTRRVKETSINIVQSKIESIREKDITKTGFRVYKDGKIGVAGALGKYDEEAMFKKAEEALNLNIPYENEPSCNRNQSMVLGANIPKGKELINEIESLLEELRKNDDFIFSNKINVIEEEVTLENNNELNLKYNTRYMSCAIIVKEKTSKKTMDLFIPYEGRNFNKVEFINFANNLLNAYRIKVQVPKKSKLPVVYLNTDMSILKVFLKDLNGRKFGSGASVFSEFIDQKKFSSDFTLYQTSHPDDDSNCKFFDQEGVVNSNYRYPLIENGVIKSPFTDKTVSKLYDLPLTGAANCEFDGVPGLKGVPNLIVKSGEKTAKELLNGEMGIFIFIAAGGDFTSEGGFGTPVQLAFLFDGEKFVGRLPELQVSSHVYNMFGEDFRGVSCNIGIPGMNSKYMIMDMDVKKL